MGIGFFSLSCQTEKKEGEEVKITLTDPLQLTGVKKTVPVDLLRPSKLISHNNKLIVFDNQTEDLFKVFRLPEIDYLYSFGTIGQGPDDFVFIDQESLNDGDFFELVDQRKLVRVSLKDTAAFCISRDPLAVDPRAPLSGLKRINDTLYLSDGFTGIDKKELRRINLSTGAIQEFGEIPTWNKKRHTFEEKKLEYSHSFCVNSKNGESAVFYYLYPKFRLFSEKNKCVKTVTILTDESSGNRKKGCIFFTESYATPSNLYVMWINKSKEDVLRDVETFRPDILVFDWEGNLQARYQLDQPVISFTVVGNKLYASSFVDANALYEYDLPQSETVPSKYRHLSSHYFSFDIYDSYHFSTNDSAGLNGTRKREDYVCGVVYLGQGNNRKYDLQTISIAAYSPIHPGLKLGDFMKYLKERKQVEPVSRIEKPAIEIDGREVRPLEKVYKSPDPKTGKESFLYSYDFVFELDGTFLVWRVSTLEPGIEAYEDDICHMISSVSLNHNPLVL